MTAGGVSVGLPCYFPSVSSVKANLRPAEYLQVLAAVRHPLYLLSAYDLATLGESESNEVDRLLNESSDRGVVILLDSGNYEAYWLRDKKWGVDDLHRVLKARKHHLAFHLDNQFPVGSVPEIAAEVETGVLREQEAGAQGTVVPIVHAPLADLPAVTREVARRLQPILIAVPERHLGEGVVARAETVARTRAALNSLGKYYPLHLLGTGNPLSILIYTACGADSYDGLEWCQTVADHATARLSHFHHWDLFSNQTLMGNAGGIPFPQKVLAHNLAYYRNWLALLAAALRDGTMHQLLREHLPGGVADKVIEFSLRAS